MRLSQTETLIKIISRPTSHVIEPSTPRIQFYTPYQRTFRPSNRAAQNGGDSDQTGPIVHVRPKEKKQESKTKVIDTNGGFDCRICLESLLDIRNKSKDVSHLVIRYSRFLFTPWITPIRPEIFTLKT